MKKHKLFLSLFVLIISFGFFFNNIDSANAATIQYKRIKLGTRGANVVALQQALKDAGCLSGKVDGIYGRITDGAVTTCNNRNSVSSNSSVFIAGISGPQTLDVGEQGTWSVTASDKDGGNLSYGVVWGDEANSMGTASVDGIPANAQTQQTATFTHIYNTSGVYNPVFYVGKADGTGQSAQTSLSVNVGNVTPTTPTPTITSILPAGCTTNMNFSTTIANTPCSGNRTSANVGDTVYLYGSNFNTSSDIVWDVSYQNSTGISGDDDATYISPNYLSYVIPSNFANGVLTIKVRNYSKESYQFSNNVKLNITGNVIATLIPSVTYTINGVQSIGRDNIVPVKYGEPVNISWTSNGDYCQGYTYNTSSSWNGRKNSSGSEVVTDLSPGDHVMVIYCYSSKYAKGDYAKDDTLTVRIAAPTHGDTTNYPPVFSTNNGDISNIQPNQTVSFSWSATDANNDNLMWTVDWGDGNYAQGACLTSIYPISTRGTGQNWKYTNSHSWTNPGRYKVNAGVYDCKGGAIEKSFYVNIASSILPPLPASTPPLATTVVPVFSTSLLPNGTVGQSYNASVDVTGYTGGYFWDLSGDLPPGLSLNASCSTAVCVGVGGTPTASGTYNFTVTLNYGSQIAKISKNFTLTVALPTTTSFAITTLSPLPNAKVGNVYGQTIEITGLAGVTSGYNWSVSNGSLPAGLALGGSCGRTICTMITGMPTASRTYNFTLKLVYGSQVATKDFSLMVDPAMIYVDKTYHPADTNNDFVITSAEVITYGGGQYASSANNIWRNGESYKWDSTMQDWIPSSSALTFNTPYILPSGTVGEIYSTGVDVVGLSGVTGGYIPSNWLLFNGSLPPGLALGNCSTAVCAGIRGTPTVPGSYSFALRFVNGTHTAQTVVRQFYLTVGQVRGAEIFRFSKFLERGSKKNDVKEIEELQKFLKKAGYDVGTPDGKFGAQTETAVIKFQTDKKLEKIDGKVGQKVRELLNSK